MVSYVTTLYGSSDVFQALSTEEVQFHNFNTGNKDSMR